MYTTPKTLKVKITNIHSQDTESEVALHVTLQESKLVCYVMKTVIFKHVFCLTSSLLSSNENDYVIILKKQNHTGNARAKVKVVDFIIMSSVCWLYRWIE